ncbi:MAG: type II secretion system GspH family protein [Lachnospiraceae bacterium]|nr:type II secretion system GspH family protein [Lachnospiraceae bacterium]
MENNKGFTLIEMIITLGLVGILLSAVAVLFPQWLDQYLYIRQLGTATGIMDVVGQGVQSELEYSTDRMIEATGLSYIVEDRIGKIPANTDDCTVTVTSDTVVINGQPAIFGSVVDPDFYHDMSVTITLVLDGTGSDEHINALIEVFNSEGKIMCSENKPMILYSVR